MPRVTQLIGHKGSKKWIQKIINEKPKLLNSKIIEELKLPKNEKIQWLSPIKCDQYAEYSDQDFIDLLDVKLARVSLADFWPKGGPQWDALGRSNTGKLFLVEAKSHIPELASTMRAEDKESRKKICDSLDKTRRFLNGGVEANWCHPFYQYANRLAHLYLLRLNELPAFLIHVYFINDLEMKGPTTIHEWQGAIRLLHLYLGIERHKLQKFIADMFIDVAGIG